MAEVTLVNDLSAQNTVSVSIANGAAVSSNFYASEPEARRGFRGLAVEVPSAWTAADIGFEYSFDGTTWQKFYGSSKTRVRLVNVPTAEGCLMLAPAEVVVLGAFPFVRLASLNTSTGANVNQGAARTLKVVFWY